MREHIVTMLCPACGKAVPFGGIKAVMHGSPRTLVSIGEAIKLAVIDACGCRKNPQTGLGPPEAHA